MYVCIFLFEVTSWSSFGFVAICLLAGMAIETYNLYIFASTHCEHALIDKDSRHLLEVFALLGLLVCIGF